MLVIVPDIAVHRYCLPGADKSANAKGAMGSCPSRLLKYSSGFSTRTGGELRCRSRGSLPSSMPNSSISSKIDDECVDD